MPKKRHLLLYYGFTFAIYIFFIFLALNMRVLWVSAIFVFVFGTGIAIPIVWKYHYKHSDKGEKERMIAQKQINSHYDIIDGTHQPTQPNWTIKLNASKKEKLWQTTLAKGFLSSILRSVGNGILAYFPVFSSFLG